MQPDKKNTQIMLMLLMVFTMNVTALYGDVQHWVLATALVTASWRLAHQLFPSVPLPHTWVRVLLNIAITYAAWVSHNGLFHREGGVAMVILAGSMKLLEPSKSKDVIMLVSVCLLILMAKLLESQTAGATLFMLVNVVAMTLILYANQGAQSTTINLRVAWSSILRVLAISVPLLVVMFVFFPRLAGPLLPNPLATKASEGFANELNPGSIAKLAESNQLAFRAKFPSVDLVAPQNRYWRGQEFAVSSGMIWRIEQGIDRKNAFKRDFDPSALIRQEILIEPGLGTWLFGLDTPHRMVFSDKFLAAKLQKTSALSFALSSPLTQRALYTVESIDNPVYQSASPEDLDPYLKVSGEIDQKTADFAKDLKVPGDDRATVDRVMDYYANGGFQYTLNPGLMSSDLVSEFIFEKKLGFCEHFATSMATILRYGGVPSRVIVGFQGGAYNHFDGYYTLTGKDAHAWVEAWIDGGWTRFDPTSMVAPARTEVGGQDYFAIPELRGLVDTAEMAKILSERSGRLFLKLGLAFEALTNRWNLFLLQYDLEYQKRLLELLGFDGIRPVHLLGFVLIVVSSFIIATWLVMKRRNQKLDKAARHYRKFLNELQRWKIPVHPSEGPLTLKNRAEQTLQLAGPKLVAASAKVFRDYMLLRYSQHPPAPEQLTSSVREFTKVSRLLDKQRKTH
jgi:transglutaminase-like putative cysteine protease